MTSTTTSIKSDPRTLFKTKTGCGIIIAMIGVIGPIVAEPTFNIIERHIPQNFQPDLVEVRNMVNGVFALFGVGGGGLGLVGRAVATGPVISPKFLPGPSNTEEFQEAVEANSEF